MSGKELEIASKENQPVSMTMPQVIQYALQHNAGAEQLEKMMELQERYEANEAKKAYHVAMTAFKANPPQIDKDKHVNYVSKKTGQVTDYKHATLANVTTTINKALSKHGLSASWVTEHVEKGIKVTCKITHIMGYSESTWLVASPDESGGKNSIQAIGSTVTYLERYTLLAGTGLATHDQDDDGEGAEDQGITPEQMEIINNLLVETDSPLNKFLEFMGVHNLDEIRQRDFERGKKALEAKKRKAQK